MPTIDTHLDNSILTITFARPEKLNALNATVLDELETVFYEAKENPDVRAILLTGTGKAFCAGADITQLAEANKTTGLAFAERGQTVFRLLETLGKPSLAAVNGHALGGGCELAMAATIRIASETAKFGQPEVKLGVIPGYGGTARLSRLVGKGRALDLCITGRFIDAATALQWGLISDVTNPENLMDKAREYLEQINNMAPQAVGAVINTIDFGYDKSLTDALAHEARAFAALCATADKNEGVSAFLEKRAANFTGD